MTKKPFPAYRRIIAVELQNLLRVRRSMNRLRQELAIGLPASGMIRTARGHMTRGMLLQYAQAAFLNGLKNVCVARRVLFRMQNSDEAAAVE